ncbi:ATP-dependent Clp protease ATP-binding subunit [Streptomyces sp. A7024]|uniref:ATP-dependent Clp protease ATP-binding subunit n=1 Tax=Streptomyces coryli TaxID=1128680 RepID=A0A6G4U9Z5_9ACTN|nr:Clp protease N-terminal domain-containing protein [Streptomyces coryli]NGN69049.1 ATP-dependent Clp protease ATP-binding subunit [Streptomyces coryli]
MDANPVRLNELIDLVKRLHPEADPLTHLEDAVVVSTRLEELADHLIGHFVDQARTAGASWTDIGQHLGVSKQAAQKRFVAKDGDDLTKTAFSFERYTLRARQVVVEAQAAARRYGHEQVRTEHLVLGLLQEPEGLAAKAMNAQGSAVAMVREAYEAEFGLATDDNGAAPDRPVKLSDAEATTFSGGAKKTLQLALREALRLGHNYIGTEHILLGLLRNEGSDGAKVLADLGITRQGSEDYLLPLLDGLK